MCNVELVSIDHWFKANKLSANFKKASKCMVTVPNSKVQCNKFHLFMGQTQLERVKEVEYLGVVLDEDFSWKS